MTTLKAGKPSAPRTGLLYTEEQLASLEKMKQKGLELGAARKEFVNHILCPDGTVISDVKTMLKHASDRVAELLADAGGDAAKLRAAANAADKRGEIEDHIAQNRFLFVVDENMTPVIYFQCATPGNPDVYPPKVPKKKEG
jgi:hypothetical protein